MKFYLHEKYPRRIGVRRIAVKILGWKIGLGFWTGPKRHSLIRHSPNWAFVGNFKGIQVDYSRLTLATKKELV